MFPWVCDTIVSSVELSKYSFKAFKETHNDLRVSFSIKNDEGVDITTHNDWL